jgi:hypothetical protein
MSPIRADLRYVAAFLAASLACLLAFGFILGLLQAGWDSRPYRLVSPILAAAVAIARGGLAAGGLARSTPLRQALAFGLLFGGSVFTYIFGPSWMALLSTAVAIGAAALGGRGADRILARRNLHGTRAAT